MKKRLIIAISMICILVAGFLIGTGFQKRTDVTLFDFSVSEDGTAISLGVQVSSSAGYVRGFKDSGGGVKPHYLTFYNTFGGVNSSFGTVSTFVLEVEPDDTEIYFNRPNGGYELVLIKDAETGEWIMPRNINSLQNESVSEDSEQWDYPPMIMVNGEIYIDTGHESTIEARCGVMDGEITSSVEGTEKPAKDNESNFGTGYGYQYGSLEGTIELYKNDKWWIFATEAVREEILFSTDTTITYNGKEYLKSELSEATLQWLELSSGEQMLSSYFPPEFTVFKESWGITLTAENITTSGTTIKCIQSSGEVTGELRTGSWYILETWTKEIGWKEMPYIIDGEIGWTAEAWTIPMDDTCEWDVKWEWLYGTIPEGKYRIGKEIMDFRGPGDYDTAIYYTEFEITR